MPSPYPPPAPSRGIGKSLIWVGAAVTVVILLVVGYVVYDRLYSDSPVSAARLPDCVVGVWKFDSDLRTVENDGATSTSSTVNATLEYKTDKTAVVTYTNATKQTTTYKDATSNTVRDITMVGTITYRYSISGFDVTYSTRVARAPTRSTRTVARSAPVHCPIWSIHRR